MMDAYLSDMRTIYLERSEDPAVRASAINAYGMAIEVESRNRYMRQNLALQEKQLDKPPVPREPMVTQVFQPPGAAQGPGNLFGNATT